MLGQDDVAVWSREIKLVINRWNMYEPIRPVPGTPRFKQTVTSSVTNIKSSHQTKMFRSMATFCTPLSQGLKLNERK